LGDGDNTTDTAATPSSAAPATTSMASRGTAEVPLPHYYVLSLCTIGFVGIKLELGL
jgi:hypothetical protein